MKAPRRPRLSLVLTVTAIAVGLLGLASGLTVALSRDNALAAGGVVDVGSPTGGVMPFAGSVPPPGWLLADGSEVSRAQYPELFAVIGTTYGAGNGTSTFNLPDLRGRVVAGLGTNADVDALTDSDGLAVAAREVKHKHTLGTLSASGGSHTHTITDPGHSHTITDPGHSHTVTDPGHSHGINDPGHSHLFQMTNGFGTGQAVPYTDSDSVPVSNFWSTMSSTTGITIRSAPTGVTVNSNSTGITGTQSKTTGITVNAASVSLPNSAFSGQVGDTSGPTDGPAYQVLHYIVKT